MTEGLAEEAKAEWDHKGGALISLLRKHYAHQIKISYLL